MDYYWSKRTNNINFKFKPVNNTKANIFFKLRFQLFKKNIISFNIAIKNSGNPPAKIDFNEPTETIVSLSQQELEYRSFLINVNLINSDSRLLFKVDNEDEAEIILSRITEFCLKHKILSREF